MNASLQTAATQVEMFRPARDQAAVPDEDLLHSANAGFLVHRQGQLRHEFRREGLDFASDMVELINPAQPGVATVLLYEELLGVSDRVHWLLHLRQPNDYRRLLDMVDHDKRWREVADMNRLPDRGGGGWERLFVEGSISETIMCPQHGLTRTGHDGHDDDGTFQPPAVHQTVQAPGELLHSANAPLTVHRAAQARYAVREEARLFFFEWAGYVNEALAGDVTALLYEEMWGRQDRIHLLIHLRSLDAYRRLVKLGADDAGLRDLLARQWVPDFKGGGSSERLFVDGSVVETMLVARHRARPAPGRA